MPQRRSLVTAFTAIPAPMRGALWSIIAAASFAVAVGLIRYVSAYLHPFEIAFFRNLFGLMFMSPWLFRAGFGVLRTERIGLFSLRAVFALGAMLSWFMALSILPLGEAVALSFTTPIFATILAALVLREVVRARRWSAIAVGFLGTLVILRPGHAAVDPASFLVLFTAVCFATSGILAKVLTRTETPNAIVTWMVIYLTPISLIPAAFVWQTPSLWHLPLLAAIGAATTMGHMGLTRAYNLAEASAVQPYQYTNLPFVALIAYFAFDEVPDAWTWLGAGIIVGAALYIARREAKAGGLAAASPVPGDGTGISLARHRAPPGD